MGQQQLIMIILGVIIVGIAIAVGISMFGGGSDLTKEATALVEVELVDITTTAASVYNPDVHVWTTTATRESGVHVYVFSYQELPIENTFTVRKLKIRNGNIVRDYLYWAQ